MFVAWEVLADVYVPLSDWDVLADFCIARENNCYMARRWRRECGGRDPRVDAVRSEPECIEELSTVAKGKRTFQPNNRRRSRVHGFRSRMSSRAGRAIVAARRRKGRKSLTA